MPDDTSPAPKAPSTGGDIAASLQASRELGPDYDDAIAAAIVERLDQTIDERVREHLAQTPPAAAKPAPDEGKQPQWTPRMTMGLLAMCFVIPLSAIGGSTMGATGIVMAWVGITLFYLISVVGFRR